MEEANFEDKRPISPLITDLDTISDVDELGNIVEGLDMADGDDGDSDEEGEECEIHDEAITKSLLHRHDHSDDFMACENILTGDISFVLGKKEVIDMMPENILETVTKTPSDGYCLLKKVQRNPILKT